MSHPPALSVFALGKVSPEDIHALASHLPALELLAVDLPSDANLGEQQAQLRAVVNSASHDWILIMRGGETVDAALAEEIAATLAPPSRAWGTRLRVVPTYGGSPLILPVAHGGEIRLFHRRHVRFDVRNQTGEMNVEGAVVRLHSPLRMEAYANAEEHREWLAAHAVPQSGARRALIFAKNAVASGAIWRSRATLRYLWVEAGWDRTTPGRGSR
ncbi:MAG: hypothetical protein ABR517_02365 [Thermoanaerobaculia bacterium]